MQATVAIFIFLISLLVSPGRVRAELPPHNPAKMQPDPNTPKARAFTPIYRGPISLYTTEFGDTQSVLLKASTEFGYQLQDVITPWYQEDDLNIASPDLDPMATFYENVQPMTVPQEVVEKSIHWSTINENIQSNVFCARIINRSQYSDAQEDISSTGLQLSMNIPRSQELYEHARKVNSLWGRHEFESLTPGYYDWNLPKELNSIRDATPYCMMNMPSKDYSELENPVTQLSTFGGGSVDVTGITPPQDIGHEVTKTLSDGTVVTDFVFDKIFPMYRVNLTEVSVDSNAQQICNIGDCNWEETNNSKHEWVGTLTDTRGLTFNFLPEHLSENKNLDTPEERAAKSIYQYTVFGITTADLPGVQLYGDDRKKDNEHPFDALHVGIERSKQMACTAVPEEILQKQAVLLSAPKVKPLTKEQKEKMTPEQIAAAEKLAKDQATTKAIVINKTCAPPEEEKPEEETSGWNCRTNIGEQASSELNAAGQNFADNQIFTGACKENNAWEQCHSDVIARAKTACIDPILALTIWLHETGASNYECSALFHDVPEDDVQDFGINVASVAPPHDFSQQLDGFLGTANARAADIAANCTPPSAPFLDFWAMYWKGTFENGKLLCYNEYPADVQNEISADVAYIQQIYSSLGGGALPTTPVVACQ